MQKLQDDQAMCQKEADDDYVCRVTDLDKQCMQNDEQHIEAHKEDCT